VARTKFLAKVAGRVSKPDGLLVVDPVGEIDFLHPLPVEAIWGVGPALAGKLHARGILTVGDLARVPEHTLVNWLGPGAGRHLLALAWNRDPRAVVTSRRAGSVGAQQALGPGPADREALAAVLLRLCDRVGARLRAKHRTARTVTVRVRGEIGTVLSRRTTSPLPLAATAAIQALALPLLEAARAALHHRVTLVGVSLSGLDREGPLQLELPFDHGAAARPGSAAGAARLRLDGRMDEIRTRFGKTAVTRASSLGAAGRGFAPDELRVLAERNDRD
jgi:DNA polymerase-4